MLTEEEEEENIQGLITLLRKSSDEYMELNWGYGELTTHLKIMYLTNVLNDILDFTIDKKIIKYYKEKLAGFPKLLTKKIKEIEESILKNNKCVLHKNIIKTNTFNYKLTKYKFLKLFGNIKSGEIEEIEEIEELIKESNPVYTILVNKYRKVNKNLIKIPVELVRYLNNFL